MAYTDQRRNTAAWVIERLVNGDHPVVYLREDEEGKLVETRKVTNLLRCEVLSYRNLGDRCGYRFTVRLPDGQERTWGEYQGFGRYDYKIGRTVEIPMGVQGASTVWIKHPKENAS